MILTHVDRKSKYTKLAILPDKSAASVQKACDASLLSIAHKIETITYDNGKEFAGHAQIAAKLGAQIYFAKPYHAWERGLNEHTNGLVRQYFPKGSDFSTLTPADVQRVEDKLNSRLRKALGYKTPSEVFFASLNALLRFRVEWAPLNIRGLPYSRSAQPRAAHTTLNGFTKCCPLPRSPLYLRKSPLSNGAPNFRDRPDQQNDK